MNSPSRRDFLKLSGLGLLGAASPNLASLLDGFPPDQQGRVTSTILWLHDQPSLEGRRVKMYWRDLVVPITGVAISADEESHNRVWYEIGTEGYAYSGDLQPVLTRLNPPVPDIPVNGSLAEVTVPFTDALKKPRKNAETGYRIYYETVHWVMGIAASPDDGSYWYQILDDKWNVRSYVPAGHLRLLPDEELAPLSPQVPDEKKRIEVRLTDQLLTAYEYDGPVFTTRISSGAMLRSGTYYTPRGLFMTYYKRPTRHMAAGDLTASGFDLPGVPWVMYITDGGVSLHGTYWHNDFGRPRSHGCINLSASDAKWLFRWTTPAVPKGEIFTFKSKGTQVLIRD